MRVFLYMLFWVLVGCSWNTRFVISNKTDDNLEISISSSTYIHAKTGELICPIVKWPRLEVSDDYLWYFNSGYWSVLPEERQIIDSLACSISFFLNPGESVVIANAGTYTGSWRGDDVIDVAQVEIKQLNKSVSYKGIELLEKFEKIDDMLYVMRVKKI